MYSSVVGSVSGGGGGGGDVGSGIGSDVGVGINGGVGVVIGGGVEMGGDVGMGGGVGGGCDDDIDIPRQYLYSQSLSLIVSLDLFKGLSRLIQILFIRTYTRLVVQGFRQEEGIDYDEGFAPVARIEAIRLFLAFASYIGFPVYQMHVKSAFLYGTIGEELYVHQPPGFIDLAHPNKRGTIDKTLFIKKNKSDIITAITPIEANKLLVKEEDGVDVDVHVYRFQVTPKASYLHAVKKLLDSNYEGANLDRKSIIEYVAAANCCGQVLWIQNQMVDYGFNFMNIKIHIDNESTICIVNNPVYHSRTKHIEIRYHFIRGCYEKRLIDILKIHTDNNVADLLTKGFDVTRFNFLVYSDKHNMVAFLKKPNESVGFTEIVDFLKGSSLRYALTQNPTIYDSLIKQFWQTATIRTLANGIQELVASIDNKEYTITEVSVRSKLQLTNATGITNLPDADIYVGLATLGYVSKGKLT
ncbi:putative ribonuclease H-like domain-containing protein [Tanacetum coccineum]